MKRIAFLGYHTDANLGDPLICQTVQYMFKNVLTEETQWIPLNLRDCFEGVPMTMKNRIIKGLFVFFRRLNHHIHLSLCDTLRVDLAAMGYDTLLRDADWGIAAGGGVIHYRTHDSWIGVCAFIKACEKRAIPVVLNAVGVEGFEPNNHRCQLLSHYLCATNVKYISTRDDYATLQKYLSCTPTKKADKVVDPAIFSSEVFRISKNPHSRTIGVGLIRNTIFRDYHADYDMYCLPTYYAGLCKGIEEMGYSWEFFTNGSREDLAVVPDIEKLMGERIKVRIPKTAEELVAIIARYRGIVSARMHSCIVAYSLQIPAVAFVWNEKLAFWGQNIKQSQNYISVDKIDARRALEILVQNLEKAPDEQVRKELEECYLSSVKTAVQMLQEC